MKQGLSKIYGLKNNGQFVMFSNDPVVFKVKEKQELLSCQISNEDDNPLSIFSLRPTMTPEILKSTQLTTKSSNPPSYLLHDSSNHTSTPPPDLLHDSPNYTSTPPPDLLHDSPNYTSTPPPDLLHDSPNYTSTPPPDLLHDSPNYTSTPPPDLLHDSPNHTSTPPPDLLHSPTNDPQSHSTSSKTVQFKISPSLSRTSKPTIPVQAIKTKDVPVCSVTPKLLQNTITKSQKNVHIHYSFFPRELRLSNGKSLRCEPQECPSRKKQRI